VEVFGTRVAPWLSITLAMETLMAHSLVDPNLHLRVGAEYREMPGMRLTTAQAARLFNLEPLSCACVLDALVNDGILWTNGREFLSTKVGRGCA
jgi:hypothetical protein